MTNLQKILESQLKYLKTNFEVNDHRGSFYLDVGRNIKDLLTLEEFLQKSQKEIITAIVEELEKTPCVMDCTKDLRKKLEEV